jgi:histone deacetylase 6
MMSAPSQNERTAEAIMDVDEQPVSETSSVAPFRNVGYVYSVEMMKHAPLPTYEHPELPERIEAIYNKIRKAHFLERMHRIPIRLAEPYEVQLIHSQDHWEKVIAIKGLQS